MTKNKDLQSSLYEFMQELPFDHINCSSIEEFVYKVEHLEYSIQNLELRVHNIQQEVRDYLAISS